jgi:hypothetical protein
MSSPGFAGVVMKVIELTLARSPLALMVTPCPPAIEFPLVPDHDFPVSRVVILLNPLVFVVLMIVLFDILHNIYILCTIFFLCILLYTCLKNINTNKHGGIGDKIKYFFKDIIGGGLKKAWD